MAIGLFTLLGITVFRGTRNSEPSRGVYQLPRNFYVFAQFCGIRYWPVIRGQIRHILVVFRWLYCMYTWFRHEIHDCRLGRNGKKCWNYWSELIWNIPSLFGRELYFSVAAAGDKYCTFVRIQGAVKINYYTCCRGKPRNLANWLAEFGKICRGKLWSLYITMSLSSYSHSLWPTYLVHTSFLSTDIFWKSYHKQHITACDSLDGYGLLPPATGYRHLQICYKNCRRTNRQKSAVQKIQLQATNVNTNTVHSCMFVAITCFANLSSKINLLILNFVISTSDSSLCG